jgi:hypothetical protein
MQTFAERINLTPAADVCAISDNASSKSLVRDAPHAVNA